MMTPMAILSNSYFFPLVQLALLALLLYAIWRDYRPLIPGGFSATVLRGLESMNALEKITGIVIAAIITIINKSVFDDDETNWKHYSAVINAFDLITIIYLCYVSPWSRNHIIGFRERIKEERR
jgi:hypothetical protein